jgi:hypothetical protein
MRADVSENMLKSGYFITILHKNSGKLSTALPPGKQFAKAVCGYKDTRFQYI